MEDGKATNYELVGEFLRKFDLPHRTEGPSQLLNDCKFMFRLNLIMEETIELLVAHRAKNLHDAADALGDLLVVVYGLGQYMNLRVDEIFARIMESNMQKERAKSAADSKRGSILDLVKPPGWKPPDLSDLL
jgi:predicted HAD superfamily Cof-like phosphohydrolase